jgi:hypothetical protein
MRISKPENGAPDAEQTRQSVWARPSGHRRRSSRLLFFQVGVVLFAGQRMPDPYEYYRGNELSVKKMMGGGYD